MTRHTKKFYSIEIDNFGVYKRFHPVWTSLDQWRSVPSKIDKSICKNGKKKSNVAIDKNVILHYIALLPGYLLQRLIFKLLS